MADPLSTALQVALGDAYRVERELSPGGMSRIFLATERSLGREVVVKVLPAELASAVSAARFRREIELAARLQHPHILPVLTADASGQLLYFIMPYVEGESLRHRLARERQLPIADATRVLTEIADALAYAHANGVVHRDVKPENILLEAGHAVLADFGIARALLQASAGGSLTRTGAGIGTPGYMAPEQAAGEQSLDARADVYALAVVGYEMLAGLPPFTGPSAQAVITAHLTARPRPLRELRPDVPPGLAKVLERAMAKLPADRFQTVAEFRDALAGHAARGRPKRALIVAAAAVGLLGIAAASVLVTRSGARAPLDPELLAVAPFDAADPAFASLREEIVDVVSRSLDGAGALRALSPSVVMRRWSGRADPVSAAALGRATGAGLAVVGSVVRAGRDSIRLSASVIDAASERSIGDFEFFESSDRIDRIADSITAGVLRHLGRARRAGAVGLAALGTRSLPAAKAFLRGERLFRRAAWDSAVMAYEEAFTLDSSFALAYNHAAHAEGWTASESSMRAIEWRLRAGRLARGLSPRDSLLLLADSLRASIAAVGPFDSQASRTRRQYALLEQVTARYPDDADSWYDLGDAYYHGGYGPTSVPNTRIIAAFERAIALDSTFAPAYPHLVSLVLREFRDTVRVLRYIDRYLALSSPDGDQHQTLRLVAALLRQPSLDSEAVQDLIRGVPTLIRQRALAALTHHPDRAETGVRFARAVLSERQDAAAAVSGLTLRAAEALAFRGYLQEAYRALGPNDNTQLAAQLFMLGVEPRDTGNVVQRWLTESRMRGGGPPNFFALLPWLTQRRDTAAIESLLVLSSRVSAGRDIPRQVPDTLRARIMEFARQAAVATRAYLAVARGDTTSALRDLASLPDSACTIFCAEVPLLTAQLLAARGRYREADSLLIRKWEGANMPIRLLFTLERARVSEQLGKREEAIDGYSLIVDAWANGDSLVQPMVRLARDGLRRLGADESVRRPVPP